MSGDGAVRIVLGYIVDDYCGLDVCGGDGAVRIVLGYNVDDYCLTFVWGMGVVRIALGYIADDYCLTFIGGRSNHCFFSISVNPVFSCIHFCQCEILS